MAAEMTEASEKDQHEPLFRLYEYANAERRFVGAAVEALARSREGLFGQIKSEPVSRVQTTQITTDGGIVVEQSAVPVRFHITIHPDDVIAGKLDSFVASLDEAAGEYLESVMPAVFDYLSRVSTATGNVVDAKGRPFFDAFYEMIEKVQMDFDEDGNHNQVLVVHPDTARIIDEAARNMTPDQQEKLDDLMKRKREESDARRRRRRLS